MKEMVKLMLEYADLLYKVAYSKTDDFHEAEDLVQETYLSVLKAINNGTEIENMRAYLLKSLNNKFYDSIKLKHSRYQVYLSDLQQKSILLECDENDFSDSDISETDDATIVRRELAFLSKKHRDILVKYYIEGKKVEEIATALNIPIGTVKSRLDSAREKIKKGIESMDSFTENSFRPDLLTVTVGGVTGMNNEPLSVITSAIEQNLLILSYDKPISIDELSKKIGIPMAFVEETVDKLVKHELMMRDKNVVWTNFLIIGEETIKEKKVIQKTFVESHFNEIKTVYSDLVDEYKNTEILKLYNHTQLYLHSLFSIHQHIREWLVNEYKLLRWDDYPDRPYGGKWIILFGQKYNNSSKEDFFSSYTIGGDFVSKCSRKLSLELKDNLVGVSPWRDNKNLDADVLGQLMYSVYREQEIEGRQLYLVPELSKLGFISINENNKMKLNIPVITENEYIQLQNITKKYAGRYIELLEKKLKKYIAKNIINFPKLIKPVSPYVHLLSMADIPLTYFYKAVDEGIVGLEKKRNYPICLVIERK